MNSFIVGAAGFVLYLVYDINSFTLQKKLLHHSFTLGTLLIAAATAWDLAKSWYTGSSDKLNLLWLLPAVLCLGALIYCLFFALPFESTYMEQSDQHKVCDQGVYALCRHPGIWCFFAAYLFLGLSMLPNRTMLVHGMLYSGLNLIYAWFQDRVTFPKTFIDYDEYRRAVPFLIPNRESACKARKSWPKQRKA